MRLGIDMQNDHILAALIERQGVLWKLIRVFKKTALSELKVELPFRVKTIVGLPRKSALMKEIPLDRNLDAKEIEFYLEKNFSKLFSENLKDCYFDFENFLSPSKMPHVRIVAVKKISMDRFLVPFAKQGFRIIAVDVDELAKSRGFSELQSLPDTEFITALGLALWEPHEY